MDSTHPNPLHHRLRVKLGSNNTVEDGSEVGFKAGNGIVEEGGTEEAATTLFTLRKGPKRPGNRRRGRGLSFSMKLPQQVGNIKSLTSFTNGHFLKGHQSSTGPVDRMSHRQWIET